jgi:hypothetical protein
MSEFGRQSQVTDAVYLTGALLASGWRMWVFVALLAANGIIRASEIVQRRGR